MTGIVALAAGYELDLVPAKAMAQGSSEKKRPEK